MAEARFGCGEFVPGSKVIPPGGINRGGGGGSHSWQTIPISRIPGPGGGDTPPPIEDFWVCICPNEDPASYNHPEGNCDPANRRCVTETQAFQLGAVRRTRSYLSQQECQNRGFAEEPCTTSYWRCDERDRLPCPPPYNERFYSQERFCTHCGRFAAGTQPSNCRYTNRTSCMFECTSVNCPTVTGVPPGSPETGWTPTVIVRTGPPTPRTWYACVSSGEFCPPPNEQNYSAIRWRVDFQASIDPNGPGFPYIHTSPPTCPSDTYSACPSLSADPAGIFDNPGGPTTTSEGYRGRLPRLSDTYVNNYGLEDFTLNSFLNRQPRINPPIEDTTLQRLTDDIIQNSPLYDQTSRATFGSLNRINVNDFFESSYTDNSESGRESVYHRIYNIFNYENYPSDEYSTNIHNLDVFNDYIPAAVAYHLRNKNSNIEWNDKYVLGISKDKLIKSIKPSLLRAFEKILDIDNTPVDLDLFLGTIKRHLVAGTIDSFDPEIYYTLAERHKNYQPLIVQKSEAVDINRRAALGLLASYAKSADYKAYVQLQDRLELARKKFLLTDIEASFVVENIEDGLLTSMLVDGGAYLESASATSKVIPTGPGDGYYFIVETVDGEEIPLELDTSLSSTFFPNRQLRKISLEMLSIDPAVTLSVNTSFADSELGENYTLPYEAKPMYYKLDVEDIEEENTYESFVTVTKAKYIKLTDADEIKEHSTTYGANSELVSILYDDPIYQYIDKQDHFYWQQSDVSFRNFTPSRSSGSFSILPRTLPLIVIINPVAATKDSVFHAQSTLEVIDTITVTRRLRLAPSITENPEIENMPAINAKLLSEGEDTYKLGLIGINDTQNIYYPYDSSKFTNSFTVEKRSAVGRVFYDLLESRIKQKYNFDYLTWWDVFSRLKMTDFAEFIYTVPPSFLTKLESGFKGYRIKPVLQRVNAVPSVLLEKDPDIEDPIILREVVRNGPDA